MKPLLLIVLIFFSAFSMAEKVDDVELGLQSIKERDYDKAFFLFKRACENGDMKGCTKLGACYRFGKGVPKDLLRAKEYFNIACDNDEMEGCVRLGVLYEHGRGVGKNISTALEYYQKACDNDPQSGCVKLSEFYFAGEAVDLDIKHAVKLLDRACSDGKQDYACLRLVDLYTQSEKVDHDLDKTIFYHKKWCEIKNDIECKIVQELKGTQGSNE